MVRKAMLASVLAKAAVGPQWNSMIVGIVFLAQRAFLFGLRTSSWNSPSF